MNLTQVTKCINTNVITVKEDYDNVLLAIYIAARGVL